MTDKEIKESILQLNTQIDGLKDSVDHIQKSLSSLRLSNANYFTNMVNVTPNTAVKVTYNESGQIVDSERLSTDDIPEIPITRVQGLQDKLSNYATTEDIQTLRNTIDRKTSAGSVSKTGTKFSVDDNGRIIEVGELTPNDIPEIPIEKIKGLRENLNVIQKNNSLRSTPITKTNTHTVIPGTGVKVSYDGSGRVTGSSKLEVSDLPNELTSAITNLSNQVGTLASVKQLNELETALSEKINEIDVTASTPQITKEDLPELNIDDIHGSQELLSHLTVLRKLIPTIKGDIHSTQSDITDLGNSIESIQADIKSITATVDKLSISVEELKNTYEEVKKIPKTELWDELQKMKLQNSSLLGRIVTLEKKLDIEE